MMTPVTTIKLVHKWLCRGFATGILLVLCIACFSGALAQDEGTKDDEKKTETEKKEAEPKKESNTNVAEAQAPDPVKVEREGTPDEGKPDPRLSQPPIDLNLHPPGVAEGGSFFSEEELAGMGLPGFAQGEPGFIPDTLPGDLFTTPGDGRSFVFETLLGETRLPHQDSQALISRFSRDPSNMLDENQARIVVPTGSITGSTETKQFRIDGGLTLFYSDVSMQGDYADIDEKNEVAVIHGNVSIVDPKYTMKTDELRIYFEAKKFQGKGFVQFKKDAGEDSSGSRNDLDKKDRLREDFAGKEFELFCKDLYYDWGTKEMTALGAVRMIHPSFNGTMERIDYNDETKEYEMSGSIVLDISDYDWVFNNGLIDEADEDKVHALTDSSTKITCDRLVYSEESGIAKFYSGIGSKVVFDQGARRIEAQYMEVNDQTKDFHAEGIDSQQVFYEQKDGEWMFLGGLVDREEVSEELVETLEKKLTIYSDSFTYNFDRKRLELVGGVSITGTGKSLTAGVMVQDEIAKFLLLRGNVTIKPDAASEILAAQVYIDTENDVFTFVGLVEGQLESADLVPVETDEKTGADDIKIQQGIFEQQGPIPGVNDSSRGNNVAGR